MEAYDLFKVQFNNCGELVVVISLWVLGIVILLPFVIRYLFPILFRRHKLVKLNIKLGGIGEVELSPNNRDVQIAHGIWTELRTRKAAIPIDEENDVVVEIYNSWYVLFGRIRDLISEVPAELLRKEKSTQQLVDIAVRTLNDGLRPHLTRWQARFRNWNENQKDQLKTLSPQEVQKQFPKYKELIADMMRVNEQLIQYSSELEKIIYGK